MFFSFDDLIIREVYFQKINAVREILRSNSIFSLNSLLFSTIKINSKQLITKFEQEIENISTSGKAYLEKEIDVNDHKRDTNTAKVKLNIINNL